MIYIDFETYSNQPIDYGVQKYLSGHADIVCLAYAIDDAPVQLWTPDQPWPDELRYNETYIAHNAYFDWSVWNMLAVPYGAPKIPLFAMQDTMALAQRYGLPGSLDKVGNILDTPMKKNPDGKTLMKRIRSPTVKGTQPVLGIDFSRDELHRFYQYCLDDVATMRDIVNNLPASSLSSDLQRIWVLTQDINRRGMPVDVVSARAIDTYLSVYMETMKPAIGELTNGALYSVNQHAKLKQWLCDNGCHVPNTQAETLARALKNPDTPTICKEVIELRQLLGGSAVKKYKTLLASEVNGRIHDMLAFHGAATGRWAGRNFQMHNLPRASVDNPDEWIRKFKNHDVIERPQDIGKALIRPMISTAGTSKILMVADYAGIENCILPWVADETETLNSIRAGECQYCRMAETIYDTPYDFIYQAYKDGKDEMRRTGKIAELGCGYGMGPDRFKEDAFQKWDVFFTIDEARNVVKAYRKKHNKIVRLWYKLKDIVVAAIVDEGHTFEYNGVQTRVVTDRVGRKWLALKLPSERVLYYAEPYVEESSHGPAPGHMGTNPKTKQWSRRRLIPGRIAENVVQALAFDIMAHGMLNVEEYYPEAQLIGTVHDEAIAEVELKYADIDLFIELLCDKPKWADGLPLSAGGFITDRYRKD